MRGAAHLEVDALCVAAAFDVPHPVVPPAVLVVTDERAAGVGRKRRLAGAWPQFVFCGWCRGAGRQRVRAGKGAQGKA